MIENKIQMMKYRAVVFDLDGTLVNSVDDLTENVNLALKQVGYPERTVEEIKRFVGNGVEMLMIRALPKGTAKEEIDKCFLIFKGYYLSNMHNRTKPYEGIIELLTELKARGIKTAVVSNKLDQATKEMCNDYFGDLIGVAIGDNDQRQRKPAADNVLEALIQIGASQEDAIYVGDTKVDVETAKNSKLPVVGVTWGYRGREELLKAEADYIIDMPMELLRFI